MQVNFTDDNGNAQAYGIENESEMTLDNFDPDQIMYLTVEIDGVTEEYEVSKSVEGGPLIRPRRPR